jgi:hypothetical protein
MARSLKPIPQNIVDLEQSQITPYLTAAGKPVSETSFSKNRGKDLSFKGDKVKDISVGLEDLDYAVSYYFNNVIKPNVVQNGQRIAVPVIYGSPERWKSVQADGFYRDDSGRLMVPLIMFKRESVEKNRSLGNKLDGNTAHLYQVVGAKYNTRNVYDKFSLVTNRIPSEQYYISAVPDYVTITYSCIIFTDYVEQNNKLVEAIEFASDAYWGDPQRWKFKARIDSFATTTLLEEGTDRAAKSTFNITLNGYIIPDTINKDLATASNKFYTTSQIVFGLETIDTDGVVTNVDELRFANKPAAGNSGGATSFIGGGINVTNIYNQADPVITNYLSLNVVVSGSNLTGSYTTTYPSGLINGTSTITILNYNTSSIPTGITDPGIMKFNFYVNGLYLEPQAIVSVVNSGYNVVVTVNNEAANFTQPLDSGDEVIGNGKFVAII